MAKSNATAPAQGLQFVLMAVNDGKPFAQWLLHDEPMRNRSGKPKPYSKYSATDPAFQGFMQIFPRHDAINVLAKAHVMGPTPAVVPATDPAIAKEFAEFQAWKAAQTAK